MSIKSIHEFPENMFITAQQMRQMDMVCIETLGIPGPVLMENAGRAVFLKVTEMLAGKVNPHVCIACGRGNNGGDGFVVARYLVNNPLHCKVFLLCIAEDLRGDALLNMSILKKMGIHIREVLNGEELALFKHSLKSSDLIIDALLGTGLRGEVTGFIREAILALNASGKPILSVDIPSGLDADTGLPLGEAVKAQQTVTFQFPKKGFLNPEARKYLGQLWVADIGMPYHTPLLKDIWAAPPS